MRATLLFTGLFTLLAGTIFSQSLYQDAKALATMLRRQNEPATDAGKLSFEFKAIKPMHHIYLAPTDAPTGVISYNLMQVRAPGDFLIRRLVPDSDSLIIYRVATDSVVAILPARFPFYLIRIKRLDAGSSGKMEVFSPESALLLEYKGDFQHEPVGIKIANSGGATPSAQKLPPEFLGLGEVNTGQTGAFSHNRFAMEKPGRYLFETLDREDTLQLVAEGKAALKMYAVENKADRRGYVYVLHSARGIDTLPGGAFDIRNTSDQVFLSPRFERIPFYEEIPVLKKSVLTTPELVLEPATGMDAGWAEYTISRSDGMDKEIGEMEPLVSRRMPLESARYAFLFDEPRTQIAFYRDAELIDTMEFTARLSFAYQGNNDKLDLKTTQQLHYTPKDVFPPVSIFSISLDSFWLVGLNLNTLQSGARSYGNCFRYSIYNPVTDQFEPFSPDRTQGDLFSKNGLYHAYLDEEVCPTDPDLIQDFKSFQPRYWDGRKRSNQALPIHWNPFAGPGAYFNPLEFLIDNGKVTFFYAPALKEETRTIFLQKKDKLPTLLGTHARLRGGELQSTNLWGEISADYLNNPLLGKALRPDLAANAFEELPGVSNATLTRQIEQEKARHYAWQQVVYDHAELKTDAQVSYEEVVRTYRTPVTTASDNLQLASEQFGSESKKLKRGLNTAAIAAGLSDFVVQRAQEELNITFLDRLRDGILNDTAEFQILFPQTGTMFSEFKIVQYRTLLDFAKNAFVLDLRNLGLNFPKLFSLYKYRTIKNDPKVYNIFLLYDIANKVYEGMPVDTVLLHVHSRLQERRADLGKSINLRLAATIRQDTVVRDSLEKIIDRYSMQLSNSAENMMFLNDAYDYQLRLLTDNPDLVETVPENFYRAVKLSLHHEVDPRVREYQLARHNLQGDPDYPYVLEHLPFSRYQEFFSKPPDPAETVSAGVALAGALVDPAQLERHTKALDNMEEALNSMKTIKMELDARKAQNTIDLSDMIPTLEAFKEMQIRRVCLDLALETELNFLDAGLKTLPEHDRQSLIYLQKTLRTPEKYQLYDWQPLEAFNQELLRSGMDTCRIRQLTDYQAIHGLHAPLNLLEEQRILVALQNRVAGVRPEIENANAFLRKIAGTIEAQLQKLSGLQEPQKLEQTQILTHRYFKYLLLTDELTSGALVFSYEKLLDKMTAVIRAAGADTTRLPAFEIYAAGRDSAATAAAVDDYFSLVRYFESQFSGQGKNRFLESFGKTPRFDQVQSEAYEAQIWEQDLLRQLQQTRESFGALRQTGAQYHQYLDALKQSNAADLLASLRQTEEFATLTEITLQWLYAFKSGSMEMDSIVALDSVVQRVTVFDAGQGGHPAREIAYDSIQVQHRQIASGPGVRQWITPQQFNEVMEDTLLRKAYLGLLYQRLSSIEGGPNYAPANMALLATKFMNTIYEVDDQRENLRYKKRINQQLGFEDYYPFIRTTIDLLNIVLETPPGAGEPLKDRFPTLARVPAVSNEVLSLFENVFAENYPNAIRNVVQLLSITWGLDESAAEQRIRKGTADAENPTVHGLTHVSRHKAGKQLERQNQQVKSAILVYGSFMANMVGAQTSSQVKAAIQAVAVPPGSSSVKRKSNFNVALNGYFGAGFHNEILTSDAVPDDAQRSSTFGLSVPIGLTASIGGLGKSENWSYSLFLPIVDVGAITAYRLNQGNTQSDLPELSFSNLIAPGAYFLVNFPKSPFTVGVGAQFGPQARKITINGLEQSSGAWRYGLIATIDVPVFNLFSR